MGKTKVVNFCAFTQLPFQQLCYFYLHMNVQYQIRISGRVQGVGFRYAARNQARALQLKGWVQNSPDGSVLSVIKGKADACLKFMEWCRSGTGYSWVDKVEVEEMSPEEFSGFQVRY